MSNIYIKVRSDFMDNNYNGYNTENSSDNGSSAKTPGWGSFFLKVLIAAGIIGCVVGLVMYFFTRGALNNSAGSTPNEVVAEADTGETTGEANASADDEESATNTSVAKTTGATGTVMDVSDIAEEVMPSIVAITNMSQTQIQDWFGQTQTYESESMGSGVIIQMDDEYLYIATNNHVVEDAESITVSFIDDSTAAATVKGTDESTDLAVVEIALSDLDKETLSNIKVATIGDSDALEVGEGAVAIGNALGYGRSVTTGVISALDRDVTLETSSGSTITSSLIQTDAAINPGNSGGALLNMDGEVIGISSAKYADTTIEGMGFAIPMATASRIINDLIEREKVDESESSYIGINGYVDVTSDLAEVYGMPEGIYVSQIVSGSAAENAGMLAGDIITKFDGKKVTTVEALQETLEYYAAGETVEIVVNRLNNGVYEEITLQLTLGRRSQ